jgi:hypothetical protein
MAEQQTPQPIELIRQAYMLAKVQDPDEEIEGYRPSEGIQLLNGILDQWSALGIYIPRDSLVTITTTANDYLYAVSPQIIQVLEANLLDEYNVQTVLMPADDKEQNLFNYANSAVSVTRPTNFYLRQNDELIDITTGYTSTNIYLYPVPDAVYTATFQVKQLLTNVTLYDQFTLPPFYFEPLKFQLAKQIALLYGTQLDANFMDEYTRLIRQLKAANKKDNTVLTSNVFASNRRFRPWGPYVG